MVISKSSKYFHWLLWLLAIKAALLLFVMMMGIIPLSPDEAQYWTWSQNLSFGYYSKPPAIAWQIALTTALFGNSETAIRLGALILGTLLPLVLYLLANQSASERAAFFSALILLLSPIGFYLSFVATTDPGSLLFATLAIMFLVKGIREEKISFFFAALSFAIALLYKWNVLWYLLLIFLLLPFYPALRRKGMGWMMFFSLLAALPSLWWNWQHDFSTFRHVSKTIVERESHANAIDFISSQFGLFSPLFLVAFFLALWPLWKVRKERRALFFTALFSLPFFLFILFSFFKKMQPNWAILFFPPMMVLAADFLEKRKVYYFRIAASIALLSSLFALLAPLLPLPYALNPYRQCMGNSRLATILSDAGYDPATDFLFSDKYQAVSLLSYYGPLRKRAYYFNISQSRKSQFSYDVQMDQQERGKNGFFVLIENVREGKMEGYEERYLKSLSPYFERVEFLGQKPLYEVRGKVVKVAIILRVINYNGKMPEERELY